jgi:hypothetical protein
LHDCALFTAGAVYVITGRDIAAEFRGKYESGEQLNAVLGPNWITRLEHIYTGALSAQGLPVIDVRQARRGDIVMHQGQLFASLGVCAGNICYFAGPQGLTAIKINDCRKAWRV